MSALGVVEVIGSDTSFASEPARPALPGVGRAAAGAARNRAPSLNFAESLSGRVEENLTATLAKAKGQAAAVPGTTTLALLARAYELTGDHVSAADTAREVLEHNRSSHSLVLNDPLAVRTSLQVLMRSGAVDESVRFAEELVIGDRLRLEIGAVLGSLSRLDDAWRFVNSVGDISEKSAIVGYLLALGGEYRRAAPILRAALREDPGDADTALNLSISLWNTGARRKALAAALQARAAAPSREDIGLHVFELLLIEGSAARVDREVRELLAQGVVPSARMLIIQARAKLTLRDFDSAIRLLERASTKARDEEDTETYAEVQSNLIRIRAYQKKITRDSAIDQLLALHHEVPDSAIIVVNLAQVVTLRSHAPELRRAADEVLATSTDAQAAFLRFQIADLEGDTSAAAKHSLDWLSLEPDNPRALAATMVAVGIGEERWRDAAEIAIQYRPDGIFHPEEVNNTAYVFAMAGMAERAIRLLAPLAEQSFVLKATLGLAHLAGGRVDDGMRLYRRAADEAEKIGDDTRSLMTAYQALVVHQLGLLEPESAGKVAAISLPGYPLPDNWADRPEFQRLFTVARRNGYGWPLEVETP